MSKIHQPVKLMFREFVKETDDAVRVKFDEMNTWNFPKSLSLVDKKNRTIIIPGRWVTERKLFRYKV